jgi:integrase
MPPLIFAGLSIVYSKAGQPLFNASGLVDRLRRHGVKHFMPHAARHTIATWLETQGCSGWERAGLCSINQGRLSLRATHTATRPNSNSNCSSAGPRTSRR